MNETDTQAAIDAGRRSVVAQDRITHVSHPLDPKIHVPIGIDADGNPSVLVGIDSLLATAYAARPRVGSTTLTEVDSFIAHVKRWGSASTVIYADINALGFTAVLDDHPPDATTTAARQHRATYACPRSTEWQAWAALDGKAQSQSAFAAFLEARFEDMVGADGKPSPVDVLDMSRRLQIYTKGTFERQIAGTNGDSTLVVKRETDADRSTPIPRSFMLGIPVFVGGARYQIEARIQFSLEADKPTFTYVLYRRVEIERDAFTEVRAYVQAETSKLVLAGTP